MTLKILLTGASESVRTKLIISTILASLTAFYMPVKGFVMPVLWLAFLDIITGLYVARTIDKVAITSREFFRKLPQFAMFIVAVTAAMHADPFFVHFGLDPYSSAKFVISFYGIYELMSILENLGKSGLPVAKSVSNFLKNKLPAEVKENLPEV